MGEGARTTSRIRAGLFEIDLDAGELFKSDQRVALQEQPFRLLSMLLERPGEVVSREELQAQLWPVDVYVGFDEGLNTAIRKLRTAFGDTADNPRFIETVPRRGYRFIAPVTRHETEPAASASPPTPIATPESKRRLPRWTVTLAVLVPSLLVVAALPGVRRITLGIFSRPSQGTTVLPIRSLAVLPLENLSNDPSQDYFADGMTDQLITDLGQIKELRVISRTSIMQYKQVRKPLAQIARELSVDAVVEGTVMRSGTQVRITAQLIEAPLDKHLWAKSYEGDLHDVLSLQSSVANAIAEEIRFNLTPQERASLRPGHTVSPQAYEDYLQGRYFWNKRDGGAMERAVEHFERAIAIDPAFAPAYAGLAQTYALFAGNVGPKDEYVAAGKKAARQALALDPSLAEAHTALALLLGDEYHFAEEEREFQLAVTLDPNYATGHHWYGEGFLVLFGRFDQANREMKQALALDPASLIIATDWGATLYLERRYDESYRQLSKVLTQDPEFTEAYLWRGRALLQEGRHKEAIADLETAYRLNPASQTIPATLAYTYALTGNRAKAISLLRKLFAESRERYVSPWAIGMVYLGLGDRPHAFDWFEKAVREHSPHVVSATVAPECDPLRTEPRFQKILATLKRPN